MDYKYRCQFDSTQHMGQTTCLPWLYIFDNVFLTQENINLAKNFNQPLVLFKLDFAKAHNKVNWKFTFMMFE